MLIPDIRVNRVNIRDIFIPGNLTSQSPLAVPLYPPVTTMVGVPIVNIAWMC